MCQNGIRSGSRRDGYECCPKACGRCGGPACSTRPGGGNLCCISPISQRGIYCQSSADVNCIIPHGRKLKMCASSESTEDSSVAYTSSVTSALTTLHAATNTSDGIIFKDMKRALGMLDGPAQVSPKPPRILLYITTACNSCHMKYLQRCWPTSLRAAPLLIHAHVLLYAGCRLVADSHIFSLIDASRCSQCTPSCCAPRWCPPFLGLQRKSLRRRGSMGQRSPSLS